MANYGYHRTSTKEQFTDRGIFEIQQFCKSKHIEVVDIFCDQQTGKNFSRPEYEFIKKRIQPGDCLIITEMDRLGRNKEQILSELRFFKEKDIRVIILEIPTTQIDYSSMGNDLGNLLMATVNNMLIEMFAVFAEAEIHKKEKRQREGIAAKKRRGDWDDYGRPKVMPLAEFRDIYQSVLTGSMTPTELQKKYDIKKSTYYRYKKILEQQEDKK